MKPKYWRIEGFDGVRRIYDRAVQCSELSEAELGTLLEELVIAHSNVGESGARLPADHQRATRHQVRRSVTLPPTFSCGDDPHFVAVLLDM